MDQRKNYQGSRVSLEEQVSVLASQKKITTMIQMKDGKNWHHLDNEVVLSREPLVTGLRKK